VYDNCGSRVKLPISKTLLKLAMLKLPFHIRQ
jgi:hypothetical protein